MPSPSFLEETHAPTESLVKQGRFLNSLTRLPLFERKALRRRRKRRVRETQRDVPRHAQQSPRRSTEQSLRHSKRNSPKPTSRTPTKPLRSASRLLELQRRTRESSERPTKRPRLS